MNKGTKPEKKRDFLCLRNYKESEIRQILDLAKDVKEHPKKYSDALEGKELALLFQKTSTRTRVSFEVGMHQLGGNSIYLDWRTTNFTLGDLSDEIRCISEYVDIVMARVYEHSDVSTMANSSIVPLINGLSDSYHPCQALADLYTVEEMFPNKDDIHIAFVGDGSNNVATSLINICAKLHVKLTIVSPKEYSPDEETLSWLEEEDGDEFVKITDNPQEGVKGADVLYTDTFVSMGQEEESTKRLEIFKPYQINRDLIQNTNNSPIIMHCLPAHRGVEITSDVLDSKKSVVFDQAQNRLHTQKALLIFWLNLSKLNLKLF